MPESLPAAAPDRVVRFLLPTAHARGAHVHLDASWKEVAGHAPMAADIRDLLGESLAAAALLGAHTKVEGRISIQASSTGALRTLFAEATAAGTVRGIARMAEGATPAGEGLNALGADGLLAVTVENPSLSGGEPMRYQGLVPLESDHLATALESYFSRSEQLPTRLLLAADGERAAGILLQVLPGESGDTDGWNRLGHLLETVHPAELLDTSAETLLQRLFHEEGVEKVAEQPVRFGCSCSRERVEDMLRALGPDEARATVVGTQAEVICEFCGKHYHFTPDEIEAVLARQPLAAPERTQ